MALDTHAVADTMADEVTIPVVAQHSPSCFVDGVTAVAWPQCRQGSLVAGPGRLEAAPLIRGGIAHNKGAAALGMIATHFDADTDDERMPRLYAVRAGVAMRQCAAGTGVGRQRYSAAIEVNQVFQLRLHTRGGLRLHYLDDIELGNAVTQTFGDTGTASARPKSA